MRKLVEALHPELIFLHIEGKNKEEVLTFLSDRLIQYKMVKPSFKKALLQREEEFPTGIQTQAGGVAIPHTDPVHVNLEAIAIGLLRKPVNFQLMGMPERSIPVELIVMFAIKDPDHQIERLQELFFIFQRPEYLKRIKKSRTGTELLTILENL